MDNECFTSDIRNFLTELSKLLSRYDATIEIDSSYDGGFSVDVDVFANEQSYAYITIADHKGHYFLNTENINKLLV